MIWNRFPLNELNEFVIMDLKYFLQIFSIQMQPKHEINKLNKAHRTRYNIAWEHEVTV